MQNKIDLERAYNMQIDLSKLIMPQGLRLRIKMCRDLDLEYFKPFKALEKINNTLLVLALRFWGFLSQGVGNY
jgi:hypothetical protein